MTLSLKLRLFSDEISKFPIGYDAEVTSDANADKLHLQVVLSLLDRLMLSVTFLKLKIEGPIVLVRIFKKKISKYE